MHSPQGTASLALCWREGRDRSTGCGLGARPSIGRSSPGRAQIIVCVVVLLLAASACSSLGAPQASAAPLSEAEIHNMPEIVAWVYRNGAVKDPATCGSVCEALESAQHSTASLETRQASQLWSGLQELESETGLWSPLSGLVRQLSSVVLAASPLRVGWHIDASGPGEGQKWMEIVGPSAPSNSSCKPWQTNLKLPGERVGPSSSYENAFASANSWYLLGCIGLGEGVANFVTHVLLPHGRCGVLHGVPPTLGGGWSSQTWHWNQCGEEIGSEVPEVEQFVSVYHAPFLLGQPVAWTGQHLEGPGTINVETNTAVDPGEAAVKKATEKTLEHEGILRTWIEWVLEGSHQPNPAKPLPSEAFGEGSEATPGRKGCFTGWPVNCATGNQTETQADLTIGGRGPALALHRTYNSQLARAQTSPGTFGYGWTGSFSAHLELNQTLGLATVVQDNGSTVRFLRAGEAWAPLGALVQATLAQEGSVYVYTLPSQTSLRFNAAGELLSETDRNGNTLTMTRGGGGRLEAITSSGGRKISLSYNGEGLIESAKDPMGHVVKYAYESGKLTSVTEPGETSARWQFKYDGSHELTTETDGRGHSITTEYDGSGRATKQTDALARTRKWEFVGSESTPETKIAEPDGSTTVEKFNALDEPLTVTRASGTGEASTTRYEYDKEDDLVALVDPNSHVTHYEYDAAGNRTGRADPNGSTAHWTYDATHDVQAETTPNGETTTIERDSHGNAIKVSRPAPGGKTQIAKYGYDSHGDLESVTDPLERTWKYEYDGNGDRTTEVDPEGDKRTWAYNEDSRETSTVTPRGHVAGAKESNFTTTIERDAQGRPIKLADPLKHETKYAYDANGNIESETDPMLHVTTYAYDADNELTKTTRPDLSTSETEYDAMGRVIAQTDGNKHTTKYVRNALGELGEVIDPLGRKTLKEYDAAGNVTKLTDAAKRTTTSAYDAANRLSEVSYSDGKTPSVKYEYDADGNRTKLIDGTGTTEYVYDQLDRLTEAKDGHGDLVGYEYDLATEQTKITYPNGKAIVRTYDKAGRLQSVTDWLEHTTRFAYDSDSNLRSTTFPAATANVDTYAYDHDGAMESVTMAKGSETLASIVYARNKGSQLTKATTKGLPGEELPAFAYDSNSRLTKGYAVAYKYDAANNPTKIGTGAYTYDNADQITTGPSVKYTYDELGERTKSAPTSGQSTSYGYDQAGNLTSVERPKEGEAAEIKDGYGYDGSGLRTSQTVPGTTSYLTWDVSAGLPLIIDDGTNSYVYGPGYLPVEQISSGGAVAYLHHDQQGSTRLLSGEGGKAEAAFTYDAYGIQTGHTGTVTTALGYDGQYTSPDTGLIYLRARTYDPATAQFLTVDPLVALTRAPYGYAGSNPGNRVDPTGLREGEIELPCVWPFCGPPPSAVEGIEGLGKGVVEGAEITGRGIESVWNEATGNGERENGDANATEAKEAGNHCGNKPPGYDPETWTKGPASRAKESGENYYDPEGGEWHWHPPDEHHERPHWDYKRLPGNLAPWDQIYLE